MDNHKTKILIYIGLMFMCMVLGFILAASEVFETGGLVATIGGSIFFAILAIIHVLKMEQSKNDKNEERMKNIENDIAYIKK